MNKISSGFVRSQYSNTVAITMIVVLGIITFGLLIPYLGFYWDDYPLAWIADTYGGEGLERYFATNRPYWGLLYRITTPLLGSTPWHWQLFGLGWRILSALSFWLFIRNLWSKKSSIALFAGITFLIYPGFTQQWISLIYSHFFIIMSAFLLSLTFTITAVRSLSRNGRSPNFYIYTFLALCLSVLNLVSLEYFFTLELIRILTIWAIVTDYFPTRSVRIRRTINNSIPYMVVYTGVAIWRLFLFPYQTNNYQLNFLERLADQPLPALLSLATNIITSVWRAGIGGWIKIFELPEINEIGRITVFISYALALLTFLIFSIWLYLVGKRQKTLPDPGTQATFNLSQPLWFGFSALLLAGWPIWLIELSPSLSFSQDRFTIPFMMGSALLLVGLLELLPLKVIWKVIILISIVSLSVGSHFRLANSYRRDWEVQRRFFWQLAWRIPGLKSGTTLLSNEIPVIHYSDNSLTAPLNWIFAPENTSMEMSYLMLYPARRLGSSLPLLEFNLPIDVDYLAAKFKGTTSQVITVYYAPPACLRVLDNKMDAQNHMLPLIMQHSAELSDYANIQTDGTATPQNIFSSEEEHGWCFYYEKADLARQQGDWERVVALSESAFALGDYPNDPAERIPYIEGYAHTENWALAVKLTQDSAQVSDKMNPVLCLLWERIDQSTPKSPEKDEAIIQLANIINCSQ